MAKMVGTFVLMSESVTMPFGDHSRPAASRFIALTLGLRPTAISTLSASTSNSLSFFRYLTFSTSPSFAMLCTAAAVSMEIPLLPSVCLSLLARSVSKRGRMSLQYSTTETSEPKLLKMEANSRPITPAPITQRRSGTLSSERISLDVMTPSISAPGIGNEADTEPVAMIM